MKSTCFKPVLFLLYLGFLAGCAPHGARQAPHQPSNKQIMLNKILDVETGEFIDEAQLNKRILSSEYLLLGETHDNKYHHQLQARIINLLRQLQSPSSVSFEMITLQQGEMLKQHAFSSSAELITILDQTKNSWPYKQDYQLVFDSVIAAGFDILPANINTDKLIKISIQGDDELPEDVRLMMKKTPLTTKQRTDLLNEIVMAHCNMLPAEVTRSMVEVQRIRDVVMSLSLLNSNAATKVLIAGTGHTRTDRGVPLYLRNHTKEPGILSLAFLDIEPDATSIDAYSQRWGGQSLPFDYVWFTPAVERQQDPCDALQHRIKQKHKKDI